MAAYPSFQELQTETIRRREAGDPAGALDLMTTEGKRFPDQAAHAFLWRIRLNCQLGQLEEALRLIAEALSAGCRYPLPVLEGQELAPLHQTVEFERLAHIAAMRYDAELAASRPKLVLRSATKRIGTILVLHGNNSRADRTVPHWEHALDLGWSLALAQAGEISFTPGMFVWNDATRARQQLMTHVDEVGRPLIVAGYSMGALRALELAASLGQAARGAIAVGPFIPREAAAHLADGLSSPTTIIVGENDREGRPGSESIERALRGRGVPVRLDIVPGMGHAYPVDMPQRLEAVLAFIAR